MHICKLDVFFLRKASVSSSVDFAETSLLLLFRMVFCWSSVSYNICEQMLVKNTKVRKTVLVWKALISLPMLYQRKYLASSFYTYSYAVNPVKECHCWLFNLLRSVMQNSSELTLQRTYGHVVIDLNDKVMVSWTLKNVSDWMSFCYNVNDSCAILLSFFRIKNW